MKALKETLEVAEYIFPKPVGHLCWAMLHSTCKAGKNEPLHPPAMMESPMRQWLLSKEALWNSAGHHRRRWTTGRISLGAGSLTLVEQRDKKNSQEAN